MRVTVIKGYYEYEGFVIVKIFKDYRDAKAWFDIETMKYQKVGTLRGTKWKTLGYDDIEFDGYTVY